MKNSLINKENQKTICAILGILSDTTINTNDAIKMKRIKKCMSNYLDMLETINNINPELLETK